MSHAHIGHALTSWGTTPDEQGLFVVAETETQLAIDESTKALEAKTYNDAVAEHLSNTLNALQPEIPSTDNEQSYGAIRALSEAADTPHKYYSITSAMTIASSTYLVLREWFKKQFEFRVIILSH